MLHLHDIRRILHESAPRDRWLDLDEIYALVASGREFDVEDLRPVTDRYREPRWKRNVRAVLQELKKHDIEWEKPARYRFGSRTVKVFYHRDHPDAHARLQRWRSDNPDGFLLNCKTTTSGLLHRCVCAHLGNTAWASDGSGDLVQQKKVCALSIRILREWSITHGMTAIELCRDCRPAEGGELVAAEAVAADQTGDFDPEGVQDARTKTIRAIVHRQGQPAFRRQLLEAYDSHCVITSCSVVEILDAAHIIAYQGPATNHPQNGLLLRTDIHTLFDLGLIAVDTQGMTIVIADVLVGTEYAALAGRRLRAPANPSFGPNKSALDRQRERAGLTTS